MAYRCTASRSMVQGRGPAGAPGPSGRLAAGVRLLRPEVERGAAEQVVLGRLELVAAEGVEEREQDDQTRHDRRRTVGVQALDLAPVGVRHRGQPGELALQRGAA